MKNKLLVFKSEMLSDQEKIRKLFQKFGTSYEKFIQSGEHAYLVESAFFLNQCYTGFEQIFKRTAVFFENNVDREQWHKSLLERMALSIEGVRPALLSEEVLRHLNELRMFRHFFRHAYVSEIDPDRFSVVALKAKKLSCSFSEDIASFMEFIDNMIAECD